MYLHLGETTVVNTKKIIGIFDIDTSTINKATRDFLADKEKNGKSITVNFDLPRSFIVTDDKIYISPINTLTLLKRIESKKSI